MPLNAEVIQGDTIILTITARNKYTDAVINLTGASISVSFAKKLGGTASLTKATGGNGVTVTNAAGGVFQVTLSASDTAALLGSYFYEVQITDASSNISSLHNSDMSPGVIHFLRDIVNNS